MKNQKKEKKEKKAKNKKVVSKVATSKRQETKAASPAPEAADTLSNAIKDINETMMKEGEQLFFSKLPEKIIELTEYMEVVAYYLLLIL